MENKPFITHVPELFEEFVDLDLLFDKDEDATLFVPLLNNHDEFIKLLVIVF